MKFIQIKDGVSVNVEAIEVIERVSDTESRLFVKDQIYIVPLPYETFKKLMVQQSSSIESLSKNIEQLAKYQSVQTP